MWIADAVSSDHFISDRQCSSGSQKSTLFTGGSSQALVPRGGEFWDLSIEGISLNGKYLYRV